MRLARVARLLLPLLPLFCTAALAAPEPGIDLNQLQRAIRVSAPAGAPINPSRLSVDELRSFLPSLVSGSGIKFVRSYTAAQPFHDDAGDTYKAGGGRTLDVGVSDLWAGSPKATLAAVLEHTRGLAASVPLTNTNGAAVTDRIVTGLPGQVRVEQTIREGGGETTILTIYLAARYLFEVQAYEPHASGHTLAWARDAAAHAFLDILGSAVRTTVKMPAQLQRLQAQTEQNVRAQVGTKPFKGKGLSRRDLAALLPRSLPGTLACEPLAFSSLTAAGCDYSSKAGSGIDSTVRLIDAANSAGSRMDALFRNEDLGPGHYPEPDGVYALTPSLIQPAAQVFGFRWAFLVDGLLIVRARVFVGGRFVLDLSAPSEAALSRLIAALPIKQLQGR